MELPGHHVCGGRGPACAVPASVKPARPIPPDAIAAIVNPTIPRLRVLSGIHVVSYAHPILWVQVDTAGAATDPNIAARTAYIRMPVSY